LTTIFARDEGAAHSGCVARREQNGEIVLARGYTSIGLRGVQEVILGYPLGKVYGLREQAVIRPQEGIIKVVAPKILTFTDVLIAKLKKSPADLFKISPCQFEEVIADLLSGMGMEVELTPATRDGGKDILAYMNTPVRKLLTLVEAKQHNKNRPVGISLIRSLFRTLVDHQATTGMLVTTSRFAKPAQQFQERHKNNS
jgi:restriction endonuclease Mrr